MLVCNRQPNAEYRAGPFRQAPACQVARVVVRSHLPTSLRNVDRVSPYTRTGFCFARVCRMRHACKEQVKNRLLAPVLTASCAVTCF
jgi:hypothetical protein